MKLYCMYVLAIFDPNIKAKDQQKVTVLRLRELNLTLLLILLIIMFLHCFSFY
jgi:hypothetical protein